MAYLLPVCSRCAPGVLPVFRRTSADCPPIARRTYVDYLYAKKASGSPQASEVPYSSSYAAIM